MSRAPLVIDRVSKACNRCRIRKIKCNGESPCPRCVRTNEECKFESVDRRRGPKVRKHQGTDAALLDRIDALEQALTASRERPQSPLTPASTSGELVELDGETRHRFMTKTSAYANYHWQHEDGEFEYFGASSASTLLSEQASNLQRIMGPNRYRDFVAAMIRYKSQGETDRLPQNLSMESRHGLMSSLEYFMTSEEHQVHRASFVTTYFNTCNLIYPILSQSEFAKASVNEGPYQKTMSNSEYARYALVLLLGKLFSETSPVECSGLDYQTVLREIRPRLSLDEAHPSICGLQALILYVLVVNWTDNLAASWIQLGRAIRMGYAMGLHRRSEPDECPRKLLQNPLRAKLFWSLYMLDIQASLATGRPSCIKSADFDQTIPEMVERQSSQHQPREHDLWHEYFVVLIRLAHIGHRIQEHFFSLVTRVDDPGASAQLASSCQNSIEELLETAESILRRCRSVNAAALSSILSHSGANSHRKDYVVHMARCHVSMLGVHLQMVLNRACADQPGSHDSNYTSSYVWHQFKDSLIKTPIRVLTVIQELATYSPRMARRQIAYVIIAATTIAARVTNCPEVGGSLESIEALQKSIALLHGVAEEDSPRTHAIALEFLSDCVNISRLSIAEYRSRVQT